MTCEYFSQRLGNAIVVSLGKGYEMGKFWFDADDGATSPLSKGEAKALAEKFVEYLNEEHPITDKMAEQYGDSEEAKVSMKLLDKMTHSDSSDEEDDELDDAELKKFKSALMMASLMGGL